jgi:hypothetical protein
MNAMPTLTGGAFRDPDTGEYRGNPLSLTVLRLVPFLGIQVLPLIDNAVLDNPATGAARIQMAEADRLLTLARDVQEVDPAAAQKYYDEGYGHARAAASHIPWALTWFTLRWMGLGPYPASLELQVERRGDSFNRVLDGMKRRIEPPFEERLPHDNDKQIPQ